MATETIRIIISVNGDRTVKRKLKDIGGQAKKSQRAVNLLKSALAGFGAGIIIRGIIKTADSYRFIQNRLRVVTKTTEELVTVQTKLFEVTRKTRASFEGTAEIYSRLAIAAQDLGVSQQEVIDVTEDLNKIVRISGTRVKEASNAMIQLSQGIASNTLRGDELRAVLEQLPVLARFIAREMGVTFGEVRDLAAQGKVTADVIFRALKSSRQEIDQRFAKVLPTVAESVLQIRNAFIKWIGEIDTATGASKKLSDILLGMADSFDAVAKAAFAATAGVAVFAGVKGIGFVILQIKLLRVAIGAFGVGAGLVEFSKGAGRTGKALGGLLSVIKLVKGNIVLLAIAGIVAAGVALFQFRDAIKVSEDGLISLGDLWRAMFGGFTDLIKRLGVMLKNFFDNFELSSLRMLGPIGLILEGIIRVIKTIGKAFIFLFTNMKQTDLAVARFLDKVLTKIRAFFSGIEAAAGALAAKIRNLFRNIFRSLDEDTKMTINGIISAINAASVGPGFPLIPLGPAEDAGEGVGEAFMRGFREVLADPSSTFIDIVNSVWDNAALISAERLAKLSADLTEPGVRTVPGPKVEEKEDPFKKIHAGLHRENELLQIGTRERQIQIELDQIRADLIKENITPQQFEHLEFLVRQKAVLEDQAELYDEIRGGIEANMLRQQALNELFDKGRINADEWLIIQRQINAEMTLLDNASFFEGIANGFDRIIESANILGQVMSDFVVGSFEELSNMVVRLASNTSSLKDQFLQTANVIVSQLLRIATQMLILRALGFAGFGPAAPAASAAFNSVTGGVNLGGGKQGFAQGDPEGFRVGGQGGPDSQLVQFMASPQERVTVETSNQQRQGDAAMAAPQVNLKVVNIDDPESLIGALETEGGEQAVINILERNVGTVRSVLGEV